MTKKNQYCPSGGHGKKRDVAGETREKGKKKRAETASELKLAGQILEREGEGLEEKEGREGDTVVRTYSTERSRRRGQTWAR